jgi:hypothetical protein
MNPKDMSAQHCNSWLLGFVFICMVGTKVLLLWLFIQQICIQQYSYAKSPAKFWGYKDEYNTA